MLMAGESLEESYSEAREGSRSCIWGVVWGRTPTKLSSGCRLGLTLGCAVGEGNSVSREDRRDFVGVARVEEG